MASLGLNELKITATFPRGQWVILPLAIIGMRCLSWAYINIVEMYMCDLSSWWHSYYVVLVVLWNASHQGQSRLLGEYSSGSLLIFGHSKPNIKGVPQGCTLSLTLCEHCPDVIFYWVSNAGHLAVHCNLSVLNIFFSQGHYCIYGWARF